MAKIENLTLCEDIGNKVMALQDESGTPVFAPCVKSPLSSITPVAVPSNYSFAIYGELVDYDNSTINTIIVTIVDCDDTECFSTGEIQIPDNPENEKRFVFAINLRNFVFTKEGTYKITIAHNGSMCFEKSFVVKAKGVHRYE